MEEKTCVFENVFQETERFLAIALHCQLAVQLPVHSFGQYLIHCKTPKIMSSAKWIIFQLHAVSAFFDIYTTLLISPYIWIPSPGGYLVGLLTYFGVPPIVQLYVGCNLLMAVGFSCLFFFENRYDIIVIGTMRRSRYRNLKRVIYFLLNFVYCSVLLVYIFSLFPDPEEGRIHVRTLWPCIPTEWIDHPNFFIMNMTHMEIVTLTTSMFILVFAQCAYFVFYTVYYLFFKMGNLSKASQRLQWRFFLALLIQATIPSLALALPMLYYSLAWKFQYYNQKYNNYAMIVTGINGLFTTIVMILAHQPYRQAMFLMISTKVAKISRIGSLSHSFE